MVPREGYYYDENFKYYRKCSKSCKTCSKGPKYSFDNSDIEEMNCIQCPQDFYKLDNTNNCYHKDNPPKKYFFKNEGIFSKCYESCMTCIQYKKIIYIIIAYLVMKIIYFFKNPLIA